ncbi:metallophosphoesterase family protein [Bradyrhizobium sp. Gha]|uniref:metallophosphoesterase family protein n=1 Tax=Bradyrhizobium sp. Gha TaxID=1855318 RepID=UPI0008E606EC|nr:metallophosphoesterase family protein [Bradyrhizobium sp. Gha]SFI08870.1 serine/threonine protein phosphatase 1 [Bradyrhizobium sp. Gha]
MTNVVRPRLPEGARVYAIGDIHGCADLLEDTFARIDADRARSAAVQAVEVYLGDLIDRGPATRRVIDMLIERAGRRKIVCLKGNHEELAIRFLGSPRCFSEWSGLGGRETLISYGLVPVARQPDEMVALANAFGAALPPAHRNFLVGLPTFYSCGDFFFVHAGVKPGVPLERQRETDLLWIRQEFLDWDAPFEKMIVHGHTPVREPDFRENRINIDTGAYATGMLTCLRIEGDTLRLV